MGVLAALVVTIGLVSLRMATWLPDSVAWPTIAIRVFGGLITGMVGAAVLIALVFVFGAWIGAGNYHDQISQVNPAMLNASLPPLLGGVIGTVIGSWAVWYLTRHITPRFVAYLDEHTLNIERDVLTDIRTINRQLQNHPPFKLHKITTDRRHNDGVLGGIGLSKKPIWLPLADFRENHLQLIGPTGSGKGIAAQILLAQSILHGDCVIVFDPKQGGDRWLPSVLSETCKVENVPFRYIDLCADVPQFNLLKGASAREIAQLLVTGLRLSRKGQESDFYRLAERSFARRGAEGEFGLPSSIPALAEALREAVGKEFDAVRGLLDQMDELAQIPALQTEGGIDLSAVLSEGGVLYVVGSDMDEDVLLLLPMIVLRLVQLIRSRDQGTGRHVVMFLDEVKYLLSRPVLNSLGLIRDRGCNLVLAHQALQDLYCIDADRETTEGVVRINCTLRLCFRQTEPETVQWIADQTGTILVDVESREINRNAGLADIPLEVRRIQKVQRPLVDANMIQQLPKGCAVLIGSGIPKLIYLKPLLTRQRKFVPVSAPKCTLPVRKDLLRPGDRDNSVL